MADLRADVQAALKTFPADAPKGKKLTRDREHINKAGNIMMARDVVKSFGRANRQLDQAPKKTGNNVRWA